MHHNFTEVEKDLIAWFCVYYKDFDLANFVNSLVNTNLTKEQVKRFRSRNHIKNGRTGFFHSEENPGYIPPKGKRNSIKTEFKKGMLPINTLPIGSIRVDRDCTLIKIDNHHKWQPYARYLWEQKNNVKLTPNDVVIHIDGNKYNDKIENLKLITRSMLVKINRQKQIKENDFLANNCVLLCAEIEDKIRRAEK